MYSVQEICEEQERQYNRLMQEDGQYCHPESFKWGFEHGFEYALSKFDWHPASELPKHSGTYIVIGKLSKLPFYATNDLDGKWCIKSSTSVQREFIDIDWWCYPPKEN